LQDVRTFDLDGAWDAYADKRLNSLDDGLAALAAQVRPPRPALPRPLTPRTASHRIARG